MQIARIHHATIPAVKDTPTLGRDPHREDHVMNTLKIARTVALATALVTSFALPTFAGPGQSKNNSGSQIEYSAAADSVYRASHLDMGN
jgi:hypothetical protein